MYTGNFGNDEKSDLSHSPNPNLFGKECKTHRIYSARSQLCLLQSGRDFIIPDQCYQPSNSVDQLETVKKKWRERRDSNPRPLA